MGISDASLRHRAVQIAAELPSDPELACRVLKYAQEVVDNFLRPRLPPDAKILVHPALAASSPNFLASATDSPSASPYQSQSVVIPGTA